MTTALVIEDNRQMSNSLCTMLRLLGVQPRQEFTPRAAILSLIAKPVDVVFLDINLPTVDGFEVLSYMRREPRLLRMPVIVVTSNDQPETYERARQGGAASVIIKPATIESLEKALRGLNLLT